MAEEIGSGSVFMFLPIMSSPEPFTISKIGLAAISTETFLVSFGADVAEISGLAAED